MSAAFIISGLPGAAEAPGLASLGTIGYEPLWLSERTTSQGIAVGGVAGKLISLDLEGSGTHALVHRLFKHTGLDVTGAQCSASRRRRRRSGSSGTSSMSWLSSPTGSHRWYVTWWPIRVSRS